MKTFEIKGTFKIKSLPQQFTKTVSAKDKGSAENKLFSLIGSAHKVPRRFITIESIKEAKE